MVEEHSVGEDAVGGRIEVEEAGVVEAVAATRLTERHRWRDRPQPIHAMRTCTRRTDNNNMPGAEASKRVEKTHPLTDSKP